MFKDYTRILAYAEDRGHLMLKAVLFLIGSVVCSIVPFFLAGITIMWFWNGNTPQLWWLAASGGGILLCLFIKNDFYQRGLTASHHLAYMTLAGMRKRVASKLLRMSMGDIDRYGVGNTKKNFVENIEEMELILAHAIPEGIANILSLLLVLLTMFFIDWRLALCAVASIIVGMFPLVLMMKDGMKRMNPWYAAGQTLNDTIIEYVGGMEVIRVFGQTTASFQKYSDAVKDYRVKTLDWYGATFGYMTSVAVLLPAVLLFLLPAGVIFFASGSLTLGPLVICMLLGMSMGAPAARIVNFVPQFPQLSYKAQKIEGVFLENDMPEGNAPAPENHDVSFENVSFSYGGADVIKNVSFYAKANTVTAIVGESGSGKSTLARLLVRFWDVREGCIKIGGSGGTDIRELTFRTLMDKISYVSQENFLFNTSVMENIRYGRPDASDDEVIAMSKLAQCHEFITQTENGYETTVGGSGDKLSGGERQRVCIARAMLKNAPIVVLDEATSFTDPENEDKIQEALSGLIRGKTVIIIAHRLSTIADADNIILLEKGEIAGQGRHEDLLSRSALYQKLWKAHSEAMDWNISGERSVEYA